MKSKEEYKKRHQMLHEKRRYDYIVNNFPDIAKELLFNTFTNGDGGYVSHFGPILYNKLLLTATYGMTKEKYCKIYGHKYHSKLPFCIICHKQKEIV